MKKILLNAILAGVLTLSLVGCASGTRVDSNKIATIQRNVTTETQVRQLFGKPNTVQMNMQKHTKILSYIYTKDNSFGRSAAYTVGAIAGGLLAGKNIGGGTGRYVSGTLGAMLGGYAGQEAIGEKSQAQALDIIIDTNTGRVVDFNYIEKYNQY